MGKYLKGRQRGGTFKGKARSSDCQPLIFYTRSHILLVAMMVMRVTEGDDDDFEEESSQIRFTVKHDKALHDPLIGCIFQSVSHIKW